MRSKLYHSRPMASTSHPGATAALSGSWIRPLKHRLGRYKAIPMGSPMWPSRPMASFSHLGPGTRQSGSGIRPPEPRSGRCKAISRHGPGCDILARRQAPCIRVHRQNGSALGSDCRSLAWDAARPFRCGHHRGTLPRRPAPRIRVP